MEPAPESLRVVLLSDAIPGRNGVGTYYDDLAAHLKDRVERVALLTPTPAAHRNSRDWAMTMPGDPTQKLYFPSPRRLWRRVREVSPHVIVSGTPGGYGLMGLAMAGLLRTAFCVGYHTQYSELAGLYWRGSYGRAYKGLLSVWDQMMFRFGSVVLVTNETLKESALALGAKDARVMGTPVQRRFLDTPPQPPPTEIRTVTFIGRLAPEKNLDQVAEATRQFPSLRFRIAGEGPLRPQVEAWAREHSNLEYLGWISRDQVLDRLDETDLLVLPSRFETFGTVAFEAMARRRLVLVSPSCGITRWPGLARGLITMRSGESLAPALGRVLEMEPERRARIASAAATAARALNAETIDAWVNVLATAVAEKRFV